jgi:transcriptional regulator of aromatic amino acid metabolism
VVPIELQPLRKRTADILALAEHVLATASSPNKQLSEEALQRLAGHAWLARAPTSRKQIIASPQKNDEGEPRESAS